jgi:hypothetical protein
MGARTVAPSLRLSGRRLAPTAGERRACQSPVRTQPMGILPVHTLALTVASRLRRRMPAFAAHGCEATERGTGRGARSRTVSGGVWGWAVPIAHLRTPLAWLSVVIWWSGRAHRSSAAGTPAAEGGVHTRPGPGPPQVELVAGAAVPDHGGSGPRGERPGRHPGQPSDPGPRRRPNVLFAAGLPVRFDRFEVAGATRSGMPGSKHPFLAPAR